MSHSASFLVGFLACTLSQTLGFRIFNGQDANVTEFMFTVRLRIIAAVGQKLNRSSICTGSFVSIGKEVFVITASHCFTYDYTILDSQLLSYMAPSDSALVFTGTVEIQFQIDSVKNKTLHLKADFTNKLARIPEAFLLSERRTDLPTCHELDHLMYHDIAHDLAVIRLPRDCAAKVIRQEKPLVLSQQDLVNEAQITWANQVCTIPGWGLYGWHKYYEMGVYNLAKKLQVGEFIMVDMANATNRERCAIKEEDTNNLLCMTSKSTNAKNQNMVAPADSGAPIVCGGSLVGIVHTSDEQRSEWDATAEQYKEIIVYGITLSKVNNFIEQQSWRVEESVSTNKCNLV